MLGHLLKFTVPNPFYVEVARGVEEHARARGYTVLATNIHHDAEAERRAIDTFLGWWADPPFMGVVCPVARLGAQTDGSGGQEAQA